MSNCTGCNSCQSCDSGCQTCNACESIDCNVKQTLCDIKCLSATQYQSNPWSGLCLAKDQIIIDNLSKAKMQAAFDWISNVAAKGALVNTASWSGSVSNPNFLSAADTVTLKNGLAKLHTTISSKSVDEVIYGSYFDNIRTKMNSATISTKACDECNVKCEAVCDVCNTCETCQSCNSIVYCGQYCGQYCGLVEPEPETPAGGDAK